MRAEIARDASRRGADPRLYHLSCLVEVPKRERERTEPKEAPQNKMKAERQTENDCLLAWRRAGGRYFRLCRGRCVGRSARTTSANTSACTRRATSLALGQKIALHGVASHVGLIRHGPPKRSHNRKLICSHRMRPQERREHRTSHGARSSI